MTSEEYLEFWDKNKERVSRLVEYYHPYYRVKHDVVISASGAEHGCELARREIRKENKEPDLESRNILYLNKIFNETWFGMPESMSSREEDGFFALCDLCSEFPDDLEIEDDWQD